MIRIQGKVKLRTDILHSIIHTIEASFITYTYWFCVYSSVYSERRSRVVLPEVADASGNPPKYMTSRGNLRKNDATHTGFRVNECLFGAVSERNFQFTTGTFVVVNNGRHPLTKENA